MNMEQERFTANMPAEIARRTTAWWGVNAARYALARKYVSGTRVLDVACGSGYGLPLLDEAAEFAVGADLDLAAVAQAPLAEASGCRRAVASAATQLPFRTGTFDVVTSFETIEHLAGRGDFVAELVRVLRRPGLLILSTPNANYTQPIDGKPRNRFHVYEYTPAELTELLGAHFSIVQLVGQSISPAFRISPFEDDWDQLPKNASTQIRLLAWRIVNRFVPAAMRDWLSLRLYGRGFYPDENDYVFAKESLLHAPVLVAICSTAA
jgi:2-polyprenyl-3-methyl-5-hydroxy-6-metoxy-1,4-benzoquinol methylase